MSEGKERKFKEFLQSIGAELYGSCVTMEQLDWNDGIQALATYCKNPSIKEEDSFLLLWIQAFGLGNQKAKNELIKRFYGGKQSYNKLVNGIVLNL